MPKIYFSKEIDKVLEKIDYSKLGQNVAIKIHFGEKGCTTYLNPEIARKVYDKLVSLGKRATLVDTNTLYRGERTLRENHIRIAKKHGFDFAPIDILDGEKGEDSIEVNGKKLGAGLKKYDSLLVLSHFKGHMMAGFGGALKNIAMGLASRAGKLEMHANVSPKISTSCSGCGTCVENCDAKAISLENGKAKIDSKKCVGCALCIVVCPHGAIRIPWASQTSEGLQNKIVAYASSALKLFNDRVVYINVLQNITADCDCIGRKQSPIMRDAGFLAGMDIVALDKASLDLANRLSEGKFDAINRIDKAKQIELAEREGIGKREYELVEA